MSEELQVGISKFTPLTISDTCCSLVTGLKHTYSNIFVCPSRNWGSSRLFLPNAYEGNQNKLPRNGHFQLRCFTGRSENFFSEFLYTAKGEIFDGEEPKFQDGQDDILELILYP